MASPPRRLSIPAEPSAADDDMDDISVTSTDYGVDSTDQDKEWIVEGIYAERPHPERPGEKQYLISWEDFPMDQCTWEPVEHLGPGLLAQWEEDKEDIAAGLRKPFDVEIYNSACREKDARRERRNAKRKRLGLPLTAHLPLESPVEEYPAEEPHVEEPPVSPALETEMDLDDAPKQKKADTGQSTPKTKHQNLIKQKTFHGIPGKPSVAGSGQKHKINKRVPTHPILSKPTQQPPKPKRAASGDGKTMTGYQGTARKLSAETKKVSNSTPKASSSLPPKITSSLANKFSGYRHTATRTQPRPAKLPAKLPPQKSNVFIGGKERKKRASLGDVMGDSSKTPTVFNSLRVINIAKKKGIEKTDAAHPDISSIPASFILTNDKRNRPSLSLAPAEAPVVQSPTAISPTNTSPTTPAPKAKKSVRFTGAQNNTSGDTPMGEAPDDGAGPIVHSPMDIDHPPEASESINNPPPRKMSLATYQERGQTQLVMKAAVFGKAGTEPIEVLFCGITRQTQPWLSAFMAQETFHFDSICTSGNFASHKLGLVEKTLSTGTIEAKSEEASSALSNVAEHLRRGSYGSHLVTENFSILVYPSRCDDWNRLRLDGTKINAEAHLIFMIYSPPENFNINIYPPASVPRAPSRPGPMTRGSYGQMLIKDLVGLDFSRFLPQTTKDKDKQVFLLFFPERENHVLSVVENWLRRCQPNCRVFNYRSNNDWVQFHQTAQAGAAGTVILHEDFSTVIRKLPGVFQLIDKHSFTFWVLTTGQYNPPRFPSDVNAVVEPGTLQMTRLFPQGRAFLITPSFALSDPVLLHKFLKWFQIYCCNPCYTIVACANFPDYLKAITLEKEAERKEMHAANQNNPNREDLLIKSGLGKQELNARFQAWMVLKEIIAKFGDEQTSEEVRKVEWITDFIDPNDEQSLVNYFCWWSSLKCDQYRKFTVLGSSGNRYRSAYRNIEIPVYTEETINDPDIASEREKLNALAQDTPLTPSHVPEPHTPLRRPSLGGDSATELRQWINDLYGRVCAKGNWARSYYKPVSWLNVAMADHFNDPRCEYDTFNNWLGGAPRFSNVNTWYGLFYTIDGEWDSQLPPSSYKRHPWIAVLRPMNPHRKADRYAEMELFIWDMFARVRRANHGKDILLDMQRRLIDHVRTEISRKDWKYKLSEVYISSETPLKYSPEDTPLNATKFMMEEMLADGKKWLPPMEFLLPAKGWVAIPRGEWYNGVTPSKAQRQKSIPRNDSDENKPRRSIFHAPHPRARIEKSACINDLFEAAYNARVVDPTCRTMKYQYRITIDWYHDMKEEGRDSSHVQVDGADAILAKLPQKR
ncbi:hypothetical protein F5Y11DRAFT_320538 [Daldinia sp. FL1419]|nr:hypothetical protein F5Y11DRAFT_320538 [Daldinia sp. FL1419]